MTDSTYVKCALEDTNLTNSIWSEVLPQVVSPRGLPNPVVGLSPESMTS